MKQKTVFLCGDCGYESPKWYGKCPSCGAWNTMSEFKEKPVSAARGTNTFQRGESRPTLLKDIDTGDESRFHSGIGELDRVLGGGAVHGSFVLVGGEPGIGKSTLLLQMCQEMCKNARVLYVSGEESLKQIKIRAARLHISSPELYILAETDMEQIINETELLEPDILIVDSIQDGLNKLRFNCRSRRYDPDQGMRDESDAVREESQRDDFYCWSCQQRGYAGRPKNP